MVRSKEAASSSPSSSNRCRTGLASLFILVSIAIVNAFVWFIIWDFVFLVFERIVTLADTAPAFGRNIGLRVANEEVESGKHTVDRAACQSTTLYLYSLLICVPFICIRVRPSWYREPWMDVSVRMSGCHGKCQATAAEAFYYCTYLSV